MADGADDLDRAAELTQQLADAAQAEVRRAAAPQQVRNADGIWPQPECVDCGEDIPVPRLELGRVRCVTCQGLLEKGRRWLR